MKIYVLIFLVIGVATLPVIVQAQEPPLIATPEEEHKNFSSPIIANRDVRLESVVNRINIVRPDIDLNQMPSLFFTPSEQSLIREARLGLTTRAPTDYELRQAEGGNVIKGPRELALGGIIYRSAGDWVVWLNGQKITPDRLPPEILDINVRKDNIKLKWFDAFTNQIFPIKLRTHQRFNIDTRIFLPGEAREARSGH